MIMIIMIIIIRQIIIIMIIIRKTIRTLHIVPGARELLRLRDAPALVRIVH